MFLYLVDSEYLMSPFNLGEYNHNMLKKQTILEPLVVSVLAKKVLCS